MSDTSTLMILDIFYQYHWCCPQHWKHCVRGEAVNIYAGLQ